LTSEQIVRLKNGFPTTEREAKEFDEKQKANELAREEYVRNLVKVRPPHHNIHTHDAHMRVSDIVTVALTDSSRVVGVVLCLLFSLRRPS
jgi:hypothetical protein